MLQLVSVVLNLLLIAAFIASAGGWLKLVRRRWGLSPRSFIESIVPVRPRERPFWTLADFLVMLGSMMLVSQLVVLWMTSQGWVEPPAAGDELRPSTTSDFLASIAATSIGGLGGIAIVLLWLRLFDQDARRQLGLSCQSGDVGLGLRSSLMILPPVMLVSAAVAYFVPYEHPVLESLAALSTPIVLAACFLGTAIVTPLVEEFMVRVLLQGALQAIADHGTEEHAAWTPRAFWPVLVSSLIFSALHFGQGAAPVPLLVLSLALGYLYRQTGSIVPPMIVHMVLNALTLIVEVLKLQS